MTGTITDSISSLSQQELVKLTAQHHRSYMACLKSLSKLQTFSRLVTLIQRKYRDPFAFSALIQAVSKNEIPFDRIPLSDGNILRSNFHNMTLLIAVFESTN